MPSTLPPARALRALLRTPATTKMEGLAVDRSMEDLAAAFRAQSNTRDPTPDADLPLLLQ